MGFAVKLDTNGTFPERLSELLDEGLVDYVAMDIKNSPERYDETCGVAVDFDKVKRSIGLLMNSSIPYEFRTTVVYPYHSAQDLIQIAKMIRGAKSYFLQSFTDSGDLIGKDMGAYKEEDLRALLPRIRSYVPSAELRGV